MADQLAVDDERSRIPLKKMKIGCLLLDHCGEYCFYCHEFPPVNIFAVPSADFFNP